MNYVDNEPEFESYIDYIPNHNLTKLSSLLMHMTLMIVSDNYVSKYIIWSNKFKKNHITLLKVIILDYLIFTLLQ